jgi:hypothetical protein
MAPRTWGANAGSLASVVEFGGMTRPFLVAALLLVTQTGGTQPHTAVMYGVGTSSCGLWLEARAGAARNKMDVRETQFMEWFDGFISAYNLYALPTPRENVLSTDRAGVRAFLDKYCRENPTDNFSQGVMKLIDNQLGR